RPTRDNRHHQRRWQAESRHALGRLQRTQPARRARAQVDQASHGRELVSHELRRGGQRRSPRPHRLHRVDFLVDQQLDHLLRWKRVQHTGARILHLLQWIVFGLRTGARHGPRLSPGSARVERNSVDLGFSLHAYGVFKTGRIRRVDVADRAGSPARLADREPEVARSRTGREAKSGQLFPWPRTILAKIRPKAIHAPLRNRRNNTSAMAVGASTPNATQAAKTVASTTPIWPGMAVPSTDATRDAAPSQGASIGLTP